MKEHCQFCDYIGPHDACFICHCYLKDTQTPKKEKKCCNKCNTIGFQARKHTWGDTNTGERVEWCGKTGCECHSLSHAKESPIQEKKCRCEERCECHALNGINDFSTENCLNCIKETSHTNSDDEVMEKFNEMTEGIADEFYSQDYDDYRKWIEEHSKEHLFTDYLYPESPLELDTDKVKQFILQELHHQQESLHKEKHDAYMNGFEDGGIDKKLALLEKIEGMKRNIKYKNGKHAGKSFCPQCTDEGANQALEDLKQSLN